MTLQDTAKLMKTNSIPDKLLSIEDVYTFAQDRENRSIRFVRIVVAYKRGEKVLAIAKQYGCSPTTVLRYARMVGLDTRDKFMPREIKANVIKQLRAKIPLRAISENLRVSQAYISKVAKEVGLNRYKKRLTREQPCATMGDTTKRS